MDNSGAPQQRLPVADGPPRNNHEETATTAMEYLRQVREEAQALPNVVIADNIGELQNARLNDTAPKNYRLRENISCDFDLQEFPNFSDWQVRHIGEFSHLRRNFARWRSTKDASTTAVATHFQQPETFGNSGAKMSKEVLTGRNDEGIHPSISTMKPLRQIEVRTMLQNIGDWLESEEEMYSTALGGWIYALLVCADQPLPAETVASLRAIARSCCRVLSSEMEHMRNSDAPLFGSSLAASASLIACVIGKCFGQNDLIPH
eukprot:m.207403 g.207403  ORF g.207403 m.207403 type:complete len:262 (-) comp18926_c0_seq8:936-1721(-)